MSRGLLVFAHNNKTIDYGTIAFCTALMAANHLHEPVSLVTDDGTMAYLSKLWGFHRVKHTFDKIITLSHTKVETARRTMRDTISTHVSVEWHNATRQSALALSPYDETILLDADYMVQSDVLNHCWGSDEDLLIDRHVVTLEHKPPGRYETYLDGVSVPLYWATVVYFRKSERVRLLFDLVAYIKANYAYFQHVYGLPGSLFRNDYAFSIAIHMLNGFLENDEIKPLPQSPLFTSFDCDELLEVRRDELVFLVNDTSEPWRFRVSNVKGIDVHVMNKFAVLRQAETIVDIYG